MASVSANIAEFTRALLGISAYTPPPRTSVSLDSEAIDRVREALGGQIEPLPQTQTRWFLADLETAQRKADIGDMSTVGQLSRAMRKDGLIAGLLKTISSGLVALPKRFRGRADIIDALTADNGTRSVFDEMFPPAELALMVADGVVCGVSVGELLPVEGRDFPVLCRLDPEFLWYKWTENRWYFRSVAGMIPITPGDGRWVLHVPGGRLSPWQQGRWFSCGRAFITKEHAMLARANYAAKLANPARVALAPNAATEEQRIGFLSKLIAWGLNSVFELPPGWDAKLLESNGKGWEVFGTEIETANFEIMIALAGQVVTVTGGAGFSNADIHRTIRADLIKEYAEALAHTLNTQGIPAWEVARFGAEALKETVRVEWDTAPPSDRNAEATALISAGNAIKVLRETFAGSDIALDDVAIVQRFGIPTIDVEGSEVPEAEDEASSEASPPASDDAVSADDSAGAEEGSE